MLQEFIKGIKVDDIIKPIISKKRVTPKLIIGNNYFISFENNNAYPCILVEIINEFDQTEVVVEIKAKISKKGYFDKTGARKYYRVQRSTVYAHQIGISPEDAVKNQVM